MSALQRLRARFSRSNRPRGFASFDGLTSLLGVAALGVATLSGVFFAPTAVPSDDAAFLSGGTIYFTTSSGDFTFSKADYPGLRAVRVGCQGAGGGGGSARAGWSAGGGGGGGYAEAVVPVGLLGTDVTVTVGSGGSGASANGSENNGLAGGASSFGSHCQGDGGAGAQASSIRGGAGAGGSGDVVFGGSDGVNGVSTAPAVGGNGGASHLGGAGNGGRGVGSGGLGGTPYGGGGGGGSDNSSGGPGADGIVIVELLY